MRNKAKKAPALLVVATADPDSYAETNQDLALFTDDAGNSYITNADLDAHASPFTGQIVEEAGIPVDVALDQDNAVVITCETCDMSSLLDATQASAVEDHTISCVACGAEIEYELDDETASEDDEEEDEIEASEDEDEDDDDVEASEEDEDDDEVEASEDEEEEIEIDASDDDDDEDEDDDDEDDEDDEDRPLDLVEFDDDKKACKAGEEDEDEDDDVEASEDADDEVEDEIEASDDEEDDSVIIIEAKKSKAKGARKPKPGAKKKLRTGDMHLESVYPHKKGDGLVVGSEEETDDNEDEVEASEETQEEEANEQPALADVALASVVDATQELELVAFDENKIAAFVGDICIATMTPEAENFELAETAAFEKGLKTAGKKVGLVAALNEAGFDLIVIKADAALANAGKVAEANITAAVEAKTGDYATRLKDCMDLVAAGSIRGMFAKGGAQTLAKAIEAKLSSLNVGNAKDVTRELLAEAFPVSIDGLIETAHDLVGKDDAVIASLKEQVAEMDASAFDYKSEPKETATVKADEDVARRLVRPARTSETASSKTQPTRRFAGIFNNQ